MSLGSREMWERKDGAAEGPQNCVREGKREFPGVKDISELSKKIPALTWHRAVMKPV